MGEVHALQRRSERWRDLLRWPSHVQVGGTETVGQAQGADLMSLPLAAHLVEIASVPGDCILDPFGGVATIGVAASRAGRRFAGCEIDPARHAIGRRHLASDSIWFNGTMTSLDISPLRTDALITSPPFGRKDGDRRTFDPRYYDDMRSIFARATSTVRDEGVAVIELMNWPEFPDGGDLVFRFFKFLADDWFYVRELVFTTPDGSSISPVASHTWITIWLKKPGHQD